MIKLDKLKPLTKKRKRVGRGGKLGGTSGRGHKGQSARSGGGVGIVFEGGQMPLSRRLPKRGFSNAPFRIEYAVVNLERLNDHFENGQTVNKQALIDKGIITKHCLVKILGQGTLDKKFDVEVDAISKSARAAIEQVGGKVQLVTKEK